jgi:hypothetical protein
VVAAGHLICGVRRTVCGVLGNQANSAFCLARLVVVIDDRVIVQQHVRVETGYQGRLVELGE